MKPILLIAALLVSHHAHADRVGSVSCQTTAKDTVFGAYLGTYESCYSCRALNRGNQVECTESCTQASYTCTAYSMDVGAGGASQNFTARGQSQAEAESQARALCQMSIAGNSAAFCLAEISCNQAQEQVIERSCRH